MRDRRFVAHHRGGPIGPDDHRALAGWAADCAEHVLSRFATSDPRPVLAIEAARAWARGEVPTGAAQRAAWASHAAAREACNPAGVAGARAAAHAAATAHMADHSIRAAAYALRAVHAAGEPVDAEQAWQDACGPPGLRDLVRSALAAKRPARFSPR